MTKKRLVVLITVLSALVLMGSASAVVITFDSLPTGNIDGIDLGGVTITSADGSTVVINNGSIGSISPPNAVTNNSLAQTHPLVLTFANPIVPSVTLTAGDRGGDQDQFTLSAFDSLNNLLGSFTTPVFGGNPEHPSYMVDNHAVTLCYSGIKRIEVSSTSGIGIDDLIFFEQVIPAIEVGVDIKPGSCPNPFNAKSNGVLPVAIIGTNDLHVTIIDPTSLELAGVPVLTDPAPELLDSTEPPAGDPADCSSCFDADANPNCDTDGDGVDDAYCGDGIMDLVAYFDTQALAAAMGPQERDACVPLTLEGMTVDGIPIEGMDSVLIRTKIKAKPAPSLGDSLTTTWGGLKSH